MTKPTGLLIPLAVSIFAWLAAPAVPIALAQEKDAKPAPVETKDGKAVETKDAKAVEQPKDAPAKDAAKAKDDGKDAKTKDSPEPTTPATPAVTPPAPPTPPATPNFRAIPGGANSQVSVIGSLVTGKVEVKFSPYGASIHSIQTTDYLKTVAGKEPYTVLQALREKDRNGNDSVWERPFSANTVILNGSDRVDLYNQSWELVGPGRYRIYIVDREEKPVLEITRTYTLGEGEAGYDLACKTTITNRSDKILSVVWEQNAQGDVEGEHGPSGDTRTIMAGYFDLTYDPNRVNVYTKVASFNRVKAVDEYVKDGKTIWPRENKPKETEFLWLSTSNRYFTTVVHRPAIAAKGEEPARAAPFDEVFEPKIGMRVGGEIEGKVDKRVLMFSLTSKAIGLNPGASRDIELNLYAGPRLKKVLATEAYEPMQLATHLVRYEMGCTWCLFQWLADLLLGFLKLIHAVLGDWGIAIIVLVLVVRLLLHPITKKAQINMTRMSKQMATLQPELAKLKEKYKNDPTKQQQEMMKLYREKGVSPMGFLGCLPMFLQMPIWVALYAMLWGAIELRHQPAFYGIFQKFGDWGFLRDLSEPDNFIKFADGGFDLFCNLHLSYSLNILPILMAVVFYFQQKMTTPPPTNEQMEQQQKMMKWMTLLFPIMFYSAPSGLTLYIMSSSLAGMVDSYFVRKHIKAEEEAGTLFQKKPPKPGGFFDRVQKMIEAKQAEMESKKVENRGKRPGDKKKR